MVDLPNNQNGQNIPRSAVSGSSGAENLKTPEKSPNKPNKIEPQETPEIGQEKISTPEAPALKEQITSIKTPQQETITSLGNDSENNPQIVDKSDELTEEHHIDRPGDKLTKEADEEEEHFIEEVEKHHGHL
jgi:hypothetical protein